MKEKLIEKIKDYVNGYVLNLNKDEVNYLLQALSQSEDINIKQIAEDFYGTCENDITIEQYVQVFQDAYTAFSERGLFNSQSEGEKERAIEFAVWIDDNGYFIDSDRGIWISYQDEGEYTDTQLYSKFIETFTTLN